MESLLYRLQAHNRWRFVGAVWLFSLLGPLIASQLPVAVEIDPSHASRLRPGVLAFVAMLFAPVVETLLFQCLPAMIACRFIRSNALLLGIVIVPFSILHLIPAAPFPSLVNGFFCGISLGFCYVVCMRRSHRYAFAVTAAVHALHNAFVFFLLA